MKKSKIIGLALGFTALAAVSISTPIIFTACSSSTAENSLAKQIYNNYQSELNNALGNQAYYQLTSQNQPKVIEVIEKNLNQVNQALKSRSVDTENLDSTIWLRSLKFELETKLKLVNSNIRYLVVNSSDVMTMTNYNKSFQDSVYNIATNYDNKTDAITKIQELNGIIQYINDAHQNLKEGLEQHVTWSGVLAKHSIGSILQKLYVDVLQQVVTNTTPTLLIDGNIKGTIFTSNSNYNEWIKNKQNSKDKIEQLQKQAQDSLDSLINFLINDYYNGIQYGKSLGEDKLVFTVSTSIPNEEDNGFSYINKYIKGLGLNEENLNTKDIGIGFFRHSRTRNL